MSSPVGFDSSAGVAVGVDAGLCALRWPNELMLQANRMVVAKTAKENDVSEKTGDDLTAPMRNARPLAPVRSKNFRR
jgi:hypothetical protein